MVSWKPGEEWRQTTYVSCSGQVKSDGAQKLSVDFNNLNFDVPADLEHNELFKKKST